MREHKGLAVFCRVVDLDLKGDVKLWIARSAAFSKTTGQQPSKIWKRSEARTGVLVGGLRSPEAMAVEQFVNREPAPALRPYIGRYIGYRLLGLASGLHRGLPSQNMTHIFSIGSEIDIVSQTSAVRDPRRYRSVVSGLHDSPALIAHDGNQEGVAVQLSPGQPRAAWSSRR